MVAGTAKPYSVEARLNALITAIGPVPASVSIADITVNGPTQQGTALTVPKNTISANGGQHYRGKAQGSFTTTGAPTAMNFQVNWGPVGNALSGTQLTSLAIPAAGLIASATNLGWRLEFDVYWQTSTSLSIELTLWWHTGSGVSASVNWFIVAQQTGLTTNVDRDLCLAFGYLGSGVTLKTHAVRIWREA